MGLTFSGGAAAGVDGPGRTASPGQPAGVPGTAPEGVQTCGGEGGVTVTRSRGAGRARGGGQAGRLGREAEGV